MPLELDRLDRVNVPSAPYAGDRNGIFRINDVDLVVPPSNITIQKEDMIHQWRALRSNATTKIPSGQGQMAVSVVIPFTGSMVLDMHRLCVEFRHSPFCYIENRFLRESIVPHWPVTQNMAFTMTGLSVAPMKGSSNTWIMQLDLTWFNYAPYVHNWLYRKDWHTVPVRSEGSLEDQPPINITIGWDMDEEGTKVPRHVVLPGVAEGADMSARTWDVVQGAYVNRSILSIEEMESLHRGEIFDLLPFPNRMQPANFVSRPNHSRIYTRYINYLQRDAMLRNFGIDVEADLGWSAGTSTPLHASMFNAILEGGQRRTYGIHTGPPDRSSLSGLYRATVRGWIRAMNASHGGVEFTFANYQELRLPQDYAEAISKAHQDDIANARDLAGLNPGDSSPFWMEWFKYQDMANYKNKVVFGRTLVRRGWSDPNGKVVPCGPLGSAVPFDTDDTSMLPNLQGTGVVAYRGPKTAARLYGDRYRHKPHWGTDFRVPIGAPIFATSAGQVSAVRMGNTSRSGTWKILSLDASASSGWAEANISDRERFKKSLLRVNSSIEFDSGIKVKSEWATLFPYGTIVPVYGSGSQFYYVKPSGAGNRITVDHGGDFSVYIHLKSSVVNFEDKVKAGQLIGYSGASGPLKDDFFKQAMDRSRDSTTAHTIIPEAETWTSGNDNLSVWKYPPHLHYEYWEELDHPKARDPSYDFNDGITRQYHSGHRGHVPVDPIPSFQISSGGSPIVSIDPALLQPDSDDVERVLNEGLDPETAASLLELLNRLWDDQWMYYDQDSDVTNVWWKPFKLDISQRNPEYLEEGVFHNDSVVLTAVAGGLRHVVANIPILGQEFPTQQHLGSVEPFYSFEFCVVDNLGKNGKYLAGLSKEGQLLMAMRGLLHQNARKFRSITDSWAVAADSFVTRLLGSYRSGDILWKHGDTVIQDNDGTVRKVIEDVRLRRRLVNTRGTSMTVEGHPGLTCHTLEFGETNPYVGEAISSTAPQKVEIDKARCEVLTKLYNFEFDKKYSELITDVLIAQLSGGQTDAPGKPDFGQFELKSVGQNQLHLVEGPALYDDGNNEYVVFGNSESSPDLAKLLKMLQPEQLGSHPDHPHLLLLPAALLDPHLIDSSIVQNTGRQFIQSTDPAGNQVSIAVQKSITTRKYDISDLINVSQETQLMADIPLQRILIYWTLVDEVLKTAERLLAEDVTQVDGSTGVIQPGGLSPVFVENELYCLPVRPSQFKFFQEWIKIAAEINPQAWSWARWTPDPGEATEVLLKNLNWVGWNKNLDADQIASLDITRNQGVVAFAEAALGGAWRITDFLWISATGILTRKYAGIYAITGVQNYNVDGMYADFFTEEYDDIHEDVAKNYLWSLPLKSVAAEDRFKEYVTDNMFGDILGELVGADGSPVFASTVDNLKKTVASCGLFMPSPASDQPWFLIEDNIAERVVVETLLATGTLEPERDETGKIALPVALYGEGTFNYYMLNDARGIYSYNSPFIWFVDPDHERQKLRYFKGLLARFADDIMGDRHILQAFGLSGLQRINSKARIKGSPAYPDMDLPHHPYYGSAAATPPDFYFWNIYDDDDAHSTATLEAMYGAMEQIVENCHKSMKSVESGGDYSPSRDKRVLEPSTDDKIVVPQYYQAEGTDGGGHADRGQTAFSYAPHPDSSEAIAAWIEVTKNGSASSKAKTVAGAVGGAIGGAIGVATASEIDTVTNVTVANARLSLSENYFGEGGGVQYPRRAHKEKYVELKKKLDGATQMFGSRAGYLGQEEQPTNVKQRAKGTVRERDSDPTHQFDSTALKLLAKQSAVDILSQKRTMRRAYPTFKLFFVEEDEFESRLLSFDDFHSYNGVTSFTVVQSRKSPADTAVITLLNVGGTLDGTKRDAVVDLDYYGEGANTVIPENDGSTRGGDPVVSNTVLDQPFGAVVLRPGLNVQLRVGYSNDPDQLQVLLNGRVVDVQWNTGGDRAEILVQSFGAELVQAIKGTSHNDDSESFPTTHHLLGAMMLEPELQHFGRWEFGQLYQVGEGQDSRLDFKDYSREGFLGRFKASNKAVKWMSDHPVITAALVIGGGSLLSRVPGIGAFFRTGTNALGRFRPARYVMSRLGLTGSSLGQRAWLGKLTAQSAQRTGQVVTAGAGRVVAADALAVLAKRGASNKVIYQYLNRVGGQAMVTEAKFLRVQAVAKIGAGVRPDRAAQIMAKAEADVLNLGLRGQWMTHPTSLAFDFKTLQNIGFKPMSNIFYGLITKVPISVAAVSAVALGIDALSPLTGNFFEEDRNRIKAYFRSKQVTMFLSPQDDNLYAPHPKDYMETYEEGFKARLKDLGLWTVRTGVSAFTYDDAFGLKVARWFDGSDPYDKRVPVDACKFKITGQTIWDIFHEMSLRHPGWVYGMRPYGNQFRYTMFFGVPSQRYWALPANSEFIGRANDLAKFLEKSGEDPDVTIDEYKRLYGDEDLNGQTIPQLEAQVREGAMFAASAAGFTISTDGTDYFIRDAAQGQGVSTAPAPGVQQASYSSLGSFPSSVGVQGPTGFVQVDPTVLTGDTAIQDTQFYKTIANQILSTRALEEYLRALELRFKPFRRYHSVTSDHDLVWNGLISSENAVYNAVDITYFDDDPKDGPAGSELFKAHAFIPEHQLRVLPLEPSFNCRGYQMAMRYGVGTLLHTMRDMYRGELIVLGNPRMRPWDIGILSDSYNEMVGPFEIEQVVHTFSHETGYITEIKPSAVVIANEISSWPVLEAMKMMTLAVKDTDDSYQGLRAAGGGNIFRAADWLLGYGAGGSEEYLQHMQELVDDSRSLDPFSLQNGDSDLDQINEIDAELSEDLAGLKAQALIGSTIILGGAAALTAAAAFRGAPFVLSAFPRISKLVPGGADGAFIRAASATAGGLGIAAAGGLALGFAENMTPSLAWLLGGPVLFLTCLRGDSIMLLPMMKNGHPIVSGLNLSDPSMIWNNFKGSLGRWADDYLGGTRDMAEVWRLYGQHSWARLNALDELVAGGSVVDRDKIAIAELTGEEF